MKKIYIETVDFFLGRVVPNSEGLKVDPVGRIPVQEVPCVRHSDPTAATLLYDNGINSIAVICPRDFVTTVFISTRDTPKPELRYLGIKGGIMFVDFYGQVPETLIVSFRR